MPLLQGVRNWWRGGEYARGVVSYLGVAKEKWKEIQERCGSDEDKAVKECIVWWLEHGVDISWRKVIHSLDSGRESEVASGLRQYAEPLSGITLQCVINL